MIDYLNPIEIGDYTAAGLSSGTATEVFVYAAGLAMDPETMRRREDAASIADETRICLENICTILAEAGLGLRDIVKTTCYVRDEAYRFEFIDAYKKAFGDGPYPARNSFVLGIASDLRVQIEAIAVRPEFA
ncbi:RidA family protein [Mycobacterium malmoense]|uniref:Enamine deaminase RidA n=1 Tax=Mycobacterium malmoense TaxID=1780 RepID=A0ABX3SU56_MYCMA|nr:RidA family protein [Mycobacterium malmoense]ORA82725.1 enamine deaminase RidA [Mycobacterium malmoense]QZA16272.1 RidA family protein [Mycobacterium malmoense]UNB93079.1 RidA family protein [Mycobacterium malmoense]